MATDCLAAVMSTCTQSRVRLICRCGYNEALPRTRHTRARHLEPANHGKVEERRRDTSDSEHGRAHGRPRSSRKSSTPVVIYRPCALHRNELMWPNVVY